MNPYTMWKEQTPRQVHELLKTYKELHKDPDADDDSPKLANSEGKARLSNGKTYKTVGNPIIPEWLKKRIPEGATVYNADIATQEDIMGSY